MDQTFFARVKDVKFQPKDGEIAYIIQLKAALEPADLTRLAMFGDRNLQVHLHVNEAGERKKAEQGNLFDPEPKVEKTKDGEAWYCAKCDFRLEQGLICTNCGQRHREPGTIAEPAPQPQGEGALSQCTKAAAWALRFGGCPGEEPAVVYVCEGHLEETQQRLTAQGIDFSTDDLAEDEKGGHVCEHVDREPEQPSGPVQCTATATHLIRYDAGDGRQGTLFCCQAHQIEVAAMAMEYCEGGKLGTVLEAEPLTEDQLGKIACAYFETPKPQDEPDPLCVCGHPLSHHGAPGEKCSGELNQQIGDMNLCDCTLYRNAEAAAEMNHEADAEAEESEQQDEMASAAGDLRQTVISEKPANGNGHGLEFGAGAAPIPLFGNAGISPEMERCRRQMAVAEEPGQ